MKKIAALTMVRNDDFFLHKWVDYYGSELGKENLSISFDGTDQVIPDFCEGTHAVAEEKIGSSVVAAEKGRLAFLSGKAAELLEKGYDLVIGVDADEYVVADPRTGMGLAEFLSTRKIKGSSISALGLDFGQHFPEEGNLTLERPFLSQRKIAQIGTRYTKPSVVARPCRWGSGFHRIKGENFHICPDLYLLHFGYSDKKIIGDRFKDGDRMAQGWEKHIRKRSRTIRFANTLPARDFDRFTKFARRCESVVRPPYAWNKPALFGLRLMVEIPERFRKLL